MQGQLYVISAPSGAGKTSLVQQLLSSLDDVMVSVSHTTRQPRPGEQNGQHYYFTSASEFLSQVESGDFLEHARVFDNYYGTSYQKVRESLDNGVDVILEIDWQGARQIRERVGDVVTVFILPPSQGALEQRLKERQQDSDDVISRRMKDAVSEMSHCDEFDYIIVNDDFDKALLDLIAVFRSHRLRKEKALDKHCELIQQLLVS